MVVLDNCALIEILRKSENGLALQRLLLSDEKIISVDLLRAEAVSVLRKLVAAGAVGKDDAGKLLSAGMSLVDEFYPLAELQVEALNEAIRLGHSTYDMFYFVLARRTGATLFTLNRKLAKLCELHGVNCVQEIEMGVSASR